MRTPTAIAVTPTGKYILSNNVRPQSYSYKYEGDIIKISQTASRWEKTIRFNLFLFKTSFMLGWVRVSLKQILPKMEEFIPQTDNMEYLKNLLEITRRSKASMEHLLETFESIFSQNKIGKYSFGRIAEDIIKLQIEGIRMIELRMVRISSQELKERAIWLAEKEKTKISGPDEEAWEELRKQGDDAKYFTWKALKDLE